MFTTGEVIDLAIQIEKNGEKVYREAGQKVSDPSVASMLQWLADEEKEHVEWFSQLKETIKESSIDPEVEEAARAILGSVLGEQSFSLAEADLSKMDQLKDLLKLTIEFEKDTALFYEMITSFIDREETLNNLKKIVEEEKRHVQVLQDFLGEEEAANSFPP